ncbi:hypothetical protein P368_21825 [Comamonas thiooxydans]|nr:hypothetical protein P369_20455 [Comamonas thiooxydans]KGG95238.1 hypothetical protein P367_21075 [Comamonas thiooxydans]KGG97475.1 hypothetical protein P365_24080 [Comamonas thiooxydans]KGH06943.1 hypothetical protein P368_21825 [Comamonas thiooxydans]
MAKEAKLLIGFALYIGLLRERLIQQLQSGDRQLAS